MSWIDLYEQELGIDRTNMQQLYDAVHNDLRPAYLGDKAAKRRLAAYNRASREFERKAAADDAGDDDDTEDEN